VTAATIKKPRMKFGTASWVYTSSRKNETAVMISGTLTDAVKMAMWFSRHNIVKSREAPEFYNEMYHIYLALNRDSFVAPVAPAKPNGLVNLDDLFDTITK
jgi:hypothetical protein